MNIAITGGTGLIGRRLTESLLSDGHNVQVIGRSPRKGVTTEARLWLWDSEKAPPPAEALEGADAVVHLAGESLSQRWTPESKQRIRDSRIRGTAQLVETLGKLSTKPRVLISGSAIGIYGSREDEVLTESASPGDDFLADLCQQWEAEANKAAAFGIRVVNLRTSVVLADGGALAQMLPPFKMGVGGKLGSGRQWMSWIHLEDQVRLIRFAIENESIRGPLNATSPNPVRNADWTRTLARVLHRPAFFTVPEMGLKILFGEMASVMLASQRVVPEAAQKAGFEFTYPDLGPALKNLLA